jgi:hypothetical protein
MKPLVVGYPRSGFTLLISVLSELTEIPQDRYTRSLKTLCDTAGFQISRRIGHVFARRDLLDDMIYNDNFRQVVGGPKWIGGPNFRQARFRKYIGLRGRGDFTLLTAHPREILDYYEITHSHVSPRSWLDHFPTEQGRRFASMRHPAGTLTSACFSLNALASEYIQRYIPPEDDNDLLRQRLALYKLSDLKFFDALLPTFKTYLEEFAGCEDQFHIMRWEDLIDHPVPTIRKIASELGHPVDEGRAAAIWAKLDHVNLTGAHKHNLRRGHGISEGWKSWITNVHLDLLRDAGLEGYGLRYGYAPFPTLDETAYTPFQQTLADYLRRGEVYRDYGDETLFGFAFNKSNIDFKRFGFKLYPWREHTCIERSSCSDDDLVKEVSDVAEESCAIFNAAMNMWIQAAIRAEFDATLVSSLARAVTPLYADTAELEAFAEKMTTALSAAPPPVETPGPVLIESRGTINIVRFHGRFYGAPQALGPIDFTAQDLSQVPFCGVTDSLDELIAILGHQHAF